METFLKQVVLNYEVPIILSSFKIHHLPSTFEWRNIVVWYTWASRNQDASSLVANIFTATFCWCQTPRCTAPNLPLPTHSQSSICRAMVRWIKSGKPDPLPNIHRKRKDNKYYKQISQYLLCWFLMFHAVWTLFKGEETNFQKWVYRTGWNNSCINGGINI